jgi:tetratricopeptide (TPR) repeat protein
MRGTSICPSPYAVSQLILPKGNKVIQDILLKTKALSFEAAFKEVMGLSLEDHERALEADMKNYREMTPAFYPKDIRVVKIECLEEYIKTNPDNIDALFDLGTLYSGSLDYEKAKQKINIIVEKQPENSLAWRSLAMVLENMNDFDRLSRLMKEISVSKDNFDSYISMADILLINDTDKAVSIICRGTYTGKSCFNE